MILQFKTEQSDVRGKRWYFIEEDKLITLFEIKKGRARGGQYHEYEVLHVLISGKVEYIKENVITKEEERKTLSAPFVIRLPQNTSDLIIALEDSLLVGIYRKEENYKFYQKHRDTVIKKMKQ